MHGEVDQHFEGKRHEISASYAKTPESDDPEDGSGLHAIYPFNANSHRFPLVILRAVGNLSSEDPIAGGRVSEDDWQNHQRAD